MVEVDIDFWQLRTRRDPALSETTKVFLAEMAYHLRLGVDRMPQAHFSTLLGWSPTTVRLAVRQAVGEGWLIAERPEYGECNRYRASLPARVS